jgi:hypothetical protein
MQVGLELPDVDCHGYCSHAGAVAVRERGQRLDETGPQREVARLFDMENLHDRNFTGPGAVDERLQSIIENWRVHRTPIRRVLQGLLGIDDQQRGAMGIWWRNRSSSGQKMPWQDKPQL